MHLGHYLVALVPVSLKLILIKDYSGLLQQARPDLVLANVAYFMRLQPAMPMWDLRNRIGG